MANRVFVAFEEDFFYEKRISGTKKFLLSVLCMLKVEKISFSVLFCSDDFIRNLNKTFRNVDSATDILSFEFSDGFSEKNYSQNKFFPQDIIDFSNFQDETKLPEKIKIAQTKNLAENFSDENQKNQKSTKKNPDEEFSYIGDIAISLETLEKNSKEFSVSQNEELKRLLIHGVLHLLGMDHGEAHLENDLKTQNQMLSLQENVLKYFIKMRLF